MKKFSFPSITFPQMLMAFGAVIVLAFVAWLAWPNKTIARVEDTYWRRHEVLLERHDYNGVGWRDQAVGDVFEWTRCESRQRGTHNCNPHRCNCRPVNFDCRCRGGDTYVCGTRTESYECRCSSRDCNCRRECTSNRNGSASCSTSCSTCRSCDTCTRNIDRTCTRPRVCDTCTRTDCDTCYDQCPTMVDWCNYRYHQWDVVTDPTTHQAMDRVTDGHDHNLRWPGLVAMGDLQRVDRDEILTVRFLDTESTRSWSKRVADEYAFRVYRIGQRWEVRWTHAGTVTPLRLIPQQTR